MTSFADTPRMTAPGAQLRPRLSPLKWNRWPIALQVAISFGLAAGFIALLFVTMPSVASAAKTYLHTAIHEGGHAFFALVQSGDVHDVTLRADGSGEVSTSSRDHVLTAGGGLLLPIVLAALVMVTGATRTMISVVSLSLAVPLFWLGYEHLHIPEVRWALWGWAALCVFIVIPGIPYVVKSAGQLVIAITLMLGIYDGLGYLSVEYLPNPDEGQPIGSVIETPEMPSDVRLIADAFSQPGIEDVRAVLFLVMGAVLIAMICVIARFLIIYRRR